MKDRDTGNSAVRRTPTLRDVATRAGVSAATVSIVLSNAARAEKYSAKTRERIWSIANEVGYVPNLLAKSLKRKNSGLIGVVMSSQHSTYYGRPLKAAERYAAELGYEVVTADMRYDYSRFEHCIQMMTSWHVEGIILMTGGRLINTSLYSRLREAGIAYVKGGVRHPDDPCSTIAFDSFDAGRMMARHLCELGHRRIGVGAANPANAASEERVRGIRSAVQTFGLPPDSLDIIKANSSEIGFAVGRAMAEELIGRTPGLTALILYNDRMAIGALRYLHERGVAVPDRISVAGFDDISVESSEGEGERLGDFLWPALTTVRTPLDEIGRECVRLLVDLIREPELRDAPRTVVFPPELVVRESTGRAPS